MGKYVWCSREQQEDVQLEATELQAARHEVIEMIHADTPHKCMWGHGIIAEGKVGACGDYPRVAEAYMDDVFIEGEDPGCVDSVQHTWIETVAASVKCGGVMSSDVCRKCGVVATHLSMRTNPRTGNRHYPSATGYIVDGYWEETSLEEAVCSLESVSEDIEPKDLEQVDGARLFSVYRGIYLGVPKTSEYWAGILTDILP